jgi:16S rRNA processing protein RimM
MTATRLRLGVVGRPQGLSGQVRVHLDNPDSDALARLQASGAPVYLDGVPVVVQRAFPLKADRARGAPKARPWLVELSGVADRTAAESLVGQVLEADRDQLAPLDDGEFYYADLEGLTCLDEAGCVLGRVARLYDAGAGDVLVVRRLSGEELELPFIDTFVLSVEPAAGRVVLALPEIDEA